MDHTDFVGRVDVTPPLGDEEAARLGRLARSRTSGNAWTPCPDGCCLVWAGRLARESPAAWLRHLLTDVLDPGHRLDGVVVGFRRASGELFSVTVANNRVHERVLRDGRSTRRPGRSRGRRTKAGGATVIDLAAHRKR